MAKRDPQIAAHLEWIGFARPVGLVVSAPALVKAGAILNRHDSEGQRLLRDCMEEAPPATREISSHANPCLPNFRAFASRVLGWRFSARGYAGTEEASIPTSLQVTLPDSGERLRPDYAVRAEPTASISMGGTGRELRDSAAENEVSQWQLLVSAYGPGTDLDEARSGTGASDLTPHGRMERLLRGAEVSAGLIFNGRTIRLISAPRGETSGWMDFRVSEMVQTAGRPLCSALRLLLSEQRLLALPREQRLTALLADSRRYQNEVSERLAEQVLHGLYELLRGFQAAHDASGGELLREPLSPGGDSNDIYRGLLTVVLRLVFLLYAEERGMLPEDGVFQRYYSLVSLYERLREDAALNPDTMDQRYGAWAQLLVLFRLIHDGVRGAGLSLPERKGTLFDPDRFKFLEGRKDVGARQVGERIDAPLVSDGAVYRLLEKLLVLDGERLSYRALDVEQIGSVYETMMGFRLEISTGRSIAIKSPKKNGAPATIDLDGLLATPGTQRAKWLQNTAERKPTDTVAKALRQAETTEDLHAALDRVIDKNATPDLAPAGALILQPTEERRRSGSHYTPRELTEPIVRHTLEPILRKLHSAGGAPPTPQQILDLKVCDPAMGSGAFLVEACRQLADALVESWRAHDVTPEIPPDEDALTFARRLIARRCLYGLDRNPMAVDLAKVSLWLATLAKDHPLTFVDHALRHGDSLLGLTRRQIEALHWRGGNPILTGFGVGESVSRAFNLRRQIRGAGEDVPESDLRELWRAADDALADTRLFGDLTLAAFFDAPKARAREVKRLAYQQAILDQQSWPQYEAFRRRMELAERRDADPPFAPFHWEVEFPEVFDRKNPGFDAFVGNPPFLGGKRISTVLGNAVRDWLATVHAESNSNADLVAHFFRRVFGLLREDGAFGLIATNTIAQGDTRSTGLRWICSNGGEIYRADRRFMWPGQAAVVVSILHVYKGLFEGKKRLDDKTADMITAFLFHSGGHDDPARLEANAGKSFVGMFLRGMGFTFDDKDGKGVATPLAEMRRLIDKEPRNREVVFPYIGGKEVNTSPTHAHHRYAVNFRDYPLRREDMGQRWRHAGETQRLAWLRSGIVPLDYSGPVAADWPDMLKLLEERVRSARSQLKESPINRTHKKRWWLYANDRPQLRSAIAELNRVLAISEVSQHVAFTFLPNGMVYAHRLKIFSLDTYAAFCALQSRVHEIWARFFGASLKDDPCYTPSDCFDTFPFPADWETHPALEAAGKAYYEFRAQLMVRNGQGLTKTYNRFHDRYENDPEIVRLRELHAAMDRVVLDIYGWSDVSARCDFILDYEIDEAEWGRRKKPYRYRWPDEIRDEVLARLIALNAERSAEEARAGKRSNPSRKAPSGPSRPRLSLSPPAISVPYGMPNPDPIGIGHDGAIHGSQT